MFLRGDYGDLRPALEAVGASVALLRVDGDRFHFVAANDRFSALCAKTAPQIIGFELIDAFPRYAARVVAEGVRRCAAEREAVECELALDLPAETRWWRATISPIFDGGAARRVFMTCVDITDEKRLERDLGASRERFEAVIATSYDGIMSIDREGRIRLVNDALLEIFRYQRGELLGRQLGVLIPERFRAGHVGLVHGFRSSPVRSRPMHQRQPVIGLRKDGTEFPLEITISKIHVGSEVEMTAVMRDASESSRMMAELRVLATTDPLTGAANRRTMQGWLKDELLRARSFEREMSVIMMDLDHFKNINDTHGHRAGDEVLKAAARAAATAVRSVDRVARVGGEEFLILAAEANLDEACDIAERIRCEVEDARPVLDGGRELAVTASFGVADLDEGVTSTDELVAAADAALYEAKRAGRNCIRTCRIADDRGDDIVVARLR